MERRTRVYPGEKNGRGMLGSILLLLAAVVIFTGLFLRDDGISLKIEPVPSVTPIPLDEAFDETMTEMEITLPSSDWYALQLGVFEQEGSAGKMAEEYVKRGAGGYIWNDGRYRVLAAVYPLRDDAQTVRQRLQQQMVESFLYEISLPAIRVRLGGMKGQLEIISAAFLHGDELIRQLQQISVMMDQQEINPDEAVPKLSAIGSQLETVLLRLKQRFPVPRPAVVEGLIDCFEDYQHFCLTLSGDESAVSLSAVVKHQTFSSLYLFKQVYDLLSHT